MDPATAETFRDAVREALDGRTLTREELIEAITVTPGLEHVGDGAPVRLGDAAQAGRLAGRPVLRSADGQPRHVQAPGPGVATVGRHPGPGRGGAGRGRGIPRAYGPRRRTASATGLSRGLIPARRVEPRGSPSWATGARRRSTSAASPPTILFRASQRPRRRRSRRRSVRLLGGFDQWVLGPARTTARIAPARRTAVSRQSGWIAPIVVAGGVRGRTWELDGDAVCVAWFGEVGKHAARRLDAEVHRLAGSTIAGSASW